MVRGNGMDKYGYVIKRKEEKAPDKRYRKAELELMIEEPDESGMQALEQVIKEARLEERLDIRHQCSSKITAYDGLAIGFYDGLTLPYEKRLVGTNALVVGGDMTV